MCCHLSLQLLSSVSEKSSVSGGPGRWVRIAIKACWFAYCFIWTFQIFFGKMNSEKKQKDHEMQSEKHYNVIVIVIGSNK